MIIQALGVIFTLVIAFLLLIIVVPIIVLVFFYFVIAGKTRKPATLQDLIKGAQIYLTKILNSFRKNSATESTKFDSRGNKIEDAEYREVE